MNDILPLFTVLLSGLFGLLVAIVTWTLANRKELLRLKNELKY